MNFKKLKTTIFLLLLTLLLPNFKQKKPVKIIPALKNALILTDNEVNSLNEGNRIVVNIPSYMLYFCKDNEIVKSYPISVGRKGKPTPEGFFIIDRKEKSPSYVPLEGSPHRKIANYFPPGRNNPFGTRLMHFYSHFYIHGLPDKESYLIGKTKEDGCIGMLNKDIEELFDYIQLGTRVDIFYRTYLITNLKSKLNCQKLQDIYDGYRRIIINREDSTKKIKKIPVSWVNLAKLNEVSPENWNLERRSLDEIIAITDEGFYDYKIGTAELVAGGDVMLGWFIDRFLKSDYDPFLYIKPVLKNSDIAFCNLEAPFTTRGEKIEKKFNFRVDPQRVIYLQNAEFDIVSIANNHIMDYGKQGLEDTIATLERASITYCGAGISLSKAREIRIIKKRGVKFAFLGYSTVQPSDIFARPGTPGVAYASKGWIKEDVKKAQNLADIVVVSLHSGVEKNYSPTRRQKELARSAIDAGAHIVLGHHPHVLEGIEEYKKGLIIYSLGNFVFGAYRGKEINKGMILQIKVNKYGIEDYNILPIDISPEVKYQPRILKGKEKEKVLNKIKKFSQYIK